MAFVIIAIVWSVLGKIDIIVTAQGKIVPDSRTKTITAVEVATVRALHVQDGQAVKAGDVLIELDTRASDSDRDKALANKQTALLQAARSRALIRALSGNSAPSLTAIAASEGITADQWKDAQAHLLGQWRDFYTKRQRLDGEIQSYGDALPLATQQAQDFAVLAKTHDVAEHAWLDKEQARITLAGQLNDARDQRSALIAETRRTAEDALSDANRIMSDSAQDEQRARIHSQWLHLVSPVDGTVQQLTVHTVGAAVPAAQPLMEIVPAGGPVEVEAFLEDKDVGFVREGQSAAVKVDAFEYTQYGTVPARVKQVSRDAIKDDKKGLLYAVDVVLDKPTLLVDGREMPLTAGMSVNVDIKTGTRRLIEYFLAPLLQHGRESLHER
jgi:hemolysin D